MSCWAHSLSTLQRHGGHAGLGDLAGQVLAGGLAHDLAALDQYAVELLKVRKVVDGVLAAVGGAVRLLAEAVKHAQADVGMVVDEAMQAAQRGFHQLVVPVDGEKSDSVIAHTHTPRL